MKNKKFQPELYKWLPSRKNVCWLYNIHYPYRSVQHFSASITCSAVSSGKNARSWSHIFTPALTALTGCTGIKMLDFLDTWLMYNQQIYIPGCHPFVLSYLKRRMGRILYPWYEVTCRFKIRTGQKLPVAKWEWAAFSPFLFWSGRLSFRYDHEKQVFQLEVYKGMPSPQKCLLVIHYPYYSGLMEFRDKRLMYTQQIYIGLFNNIERPQLWKWEIRVLKHAWSL